MPLKKLFCLPSARSAMYYCAVQFKDLAILDRSTFGHALYNYGHLTRLATRFEGSNAFSTHLTQAEIIFGDDSRFFNAVGELAERGSYHGVFVLPNVIGGVLGKDLSAMAEEAEKKFNLPVFTVDAHQDANFMDGQQLFYMNMFKKMADSNQLKKEYTYNLLCAGPFDCFAAADAAYIKKLLYKKLGLVCNFDLSQVISVWDWKDFGRAGLNIVCSDAGVKLAVEAQQQCGIPYLRLYPLGENMESDGLSEIAAFFGIPFRTRQDARFAEVCREFGNILSVFKTKIICFATADKLRALRSFLQLFDVDAEYWCPYFTTGFKTVNEDECLSFCKGNDVLFIGFDRLAKQFSHAISLEKSGLDYHLQIPFRIPFVGKTGAYRLMQMIVDGLI